MNQYRMPLWLAIRRTGGPYLAIRRLDQNKTQPPTPSKQGQQG